MISNFLKYSIKRWRASHGLGITRAAITEYWWCELLAGVASNVI